MSKMRVVALAGAVMCAVVAGVLVKNMLGKRKDQAEPVASKTESVDVLVATKDLVMGDKLAEGVIWKPMPKESISEFMVSRGRQPEALKEMAAARVRMNVFKDEPIITKKVVMPGSNGFISATLPKGMRAVAFAIAPKFSAGGFILPNDRVDILFSRRITPVGNLNGSKITKTETIISDVRVLAINLVYKQANEGETASVEKGETATVELTPQQAEILSMAQGTLDSDLSMTLRSIAENEGRPEAEIKPVLADNYAGRSEKKPANSLVIIRGGVETYANAQ